MPTYVALPENTRKRFNSWPVKARVSPNHQPPVASESRFIAAPVWAAPKASPTLVKAGTTKSYRDLKPKRYGAR